MTLLSLLQTAQAVAVAAQDSAAGDYLVRGAIALILGLQAWSIRTVNKTREDLGVITQALFGRRGDNGIERTVEAHGAELVDHDRRLTQSEGRLDRIDVERRPLAPHRGGIT
jgi:hypothetical protein